MIRLRSGEAVVEIAPSVGGAIASFTLAGVDVLRPTPAAALAEGNVRAFACYPLVPYSNRIAGARLAFDGREHALARNFGDSPHAIHGIGWQRAWAVAGSAETHAQIVLEHAARGDDAAAWPWPFRATQTFALSASAHGAALHLRLAIENTGERAFPFGLGWHPFFPKTPDTTLAFEAAHVWENDTTQVPVRRVPVPAASMLRARWARSRSITCSSPRPARRRSRGPRRASRSPSTPTARSTGASSTCRRAATSSRSSRRAT